MAIKDIFKQHKSGGIVPCDLGLQGLQNLLPKVLLCEKCGVNNSATKYIKQDSRWDESDLNQANKLEGFYSVLDFQADHTKRIVAVREHLRHSCNCCGYVWFGEVLNESGQ